MWRKLLLPLAVGELQLSYLVENSGAAAGETVVQLYTRDLVATLVRPVMELKAFVRLRLDAGQSQRIRFIVPCDMLSFTLRNNQRVVEPGEIEMLVGFSSREIVLRQTVEITGAMRTLGTRWRMSSSAFVAET